MKELSFPQTAPTDNAFFQPDWAGAYWGHWAGDRTVAGLVCRLRMWYCWSAVSGCGAPLQRQEMKKGPVRALPVAASIPKSASF